jgi:hypothetical protein
MEAAKGSSHTRSSVDQRLPLRVVPDECLEVSLQDITGNCHLSLLIAQNENDLESHDGQTQRQCAPAYHWLRLRSV